MNSRPLVETDLPFFREIITFSESWLEEEGLSGTENDHNLITYLHSYDEVGGTWLIWTDNEEKIGATYHVYAAPSNDKPWLGTIIVAPEKRNQGYAKKILNELSSSLSNHHKILFASSPSNHDDWIRFLNHQGFEQLGIEKDDSGKEYLKLIKVLHD